MVGVLTVCSHFIEEQNEIGDNIRTLNPCKDNFYSDHLGSACQI